MPRYQVTLDGRTFVLEGDHPPTEDEARAAIGEHASAPAPKSAAAPEPSFTDRILADNPALPPMLRGAQGVLRFAKANPVQAGAIAGGLASAPFTGGMSIPASMGLAGLGAAGGAAYGQLAKGATTGDFGTPSGNAAQIAKEGALGAGGEGFGRAAGQALRFAGRVVYKSALRPAMALQRDFGDIAATGLREGVPVTDAGAARVTEQLGDLGNKTRGILAAKDAERPIVRGYLPPAQGVELGSAPIHPTMPDLRDARSAGVLMRDLPPTPGGGAPAQMVAPAEIAQRGLGAARSDLSNRALAGDALDEIGALENRFLSQRTRPMSLVDTQAMKQAEQELADSAYKAQAMGHPVNGVETQFHRGIARGSREAIEQRAPEVAPLNQQAQKLIGLKLALEDAGRRNIPSVWGLRSLLGDFMPAASSRAGIAADRAGQYAPLPASFKTALIAALGGQD